MRLIALTGGIGSGKTTVARIFELLSVPVYHADSAARRLMEHNQELQNMLIEKFGPSSFFEDGSLNRSFISGIVFNDREKLNWLNKTVHPYVSQDLRRWAQHSEAPYGIMETALLRESMQLTQFYKIISVSAPQALRLKRIANRDGLSQDEILKRMQSQLKDEELSECADYIIYNDGTQSLVRQIQNIHKSICSDISA